MRTLDLESQFIHLRSQDFPLRTIAEKIGIPKSTLSDWEKRYYGDIQIARAEAWDQTEEDAAFTPHDDLKALLAIITTCQDELVRRRESMKTHELIRLMFAARRDYFRRRDAFMKPLNNLRNKSCFRTTLKLADRLKDVLGILPQIEAERDALSKTLSPDKTGQTTDKNPDITPNLHNDNHLPPDKNPDNPASVAPELRAEPRCETESNLRGLASSPSSENHNPQPADAVHDSAPISLPPTFPPTPPLVPNPQLSTLNSQQPDDDFLGSIVINPLECGAGIVAKWLEHEAAHRARIVRFSVLRNTSESLPIEIHDSTNRYYV